MSDKKTEEFSHQKLVDENILESGSVILGFAVADQKLDVGDFIRKLFRPSDSQILPPQILIQEFYGLAFCQITFIFPVSVLQDSRKMLRLIRILKWRDNKVEQNPHTD